MYTQVDFLLLHFSFQKAITLPVTIHRQFEFNVCLSMTSGNTYFWLKIYKFDKYLMAKITKWKMIFHLKGGQ